MLFFLPFSFLPCQHAPICMKEEIQLSVMSGLRCWLKTHLRPYRRSEVCQVCSTFYYFPFLFHCTLHSESMILFWIWWKQFRHHELLIMIEAKHHKSTSIVEFWTFYYFMANRIHRLLHWGRDSVWVKLAFRHVHYSWVWSSQTLSNTIPCLAHSSLLLPAFGCSEGSAAGANLTTIHYKQPLSHIQFEHPYSSFVSYWVLIQKNLSARSTSLGPFVWVFSGSVQNWSCSFQAPFWI